GVATGLHLYDPNTGDWNVPAVARECADRPLALVEWARRRRGLILAETAPDAVESLLDAAGLRMAARQAEAGSQQLFEHLLTEAGGAPKGVETSLEARSETDAVLAVATGKADFCFGLEAVASPYRLRFIPIIEERFDLLVDRRAWFEAPMQTLLEFCRSKAFQRHADSITGCDLSGLGRVWWNGP
ncbi:MAG: substrate-binding domain-containing protein, partial [Rhodobacteraceae bacterium]|nr:substrate-binding domain-containing protein [Paracoccaceae bacterium]